MKTYFIVFFLLISSLLHSQERINSVEDLESLPPYEAVVDYFFDNYKISMPQLVKIDRKPEGWNVRLLDATDFETVVFESPVWQFSRQEWVDVPVEKDTKDKSKEKATFLNNNRPKWYSIYPFYGYQGWDIDNIHFLNNKNNLSDTLLYALGRSYSNFANRQIRSQYGFGSVEGRDYGYEKIPVQVSDTLVLLFREAIKRYAKLNDRNPHFQTIVGDINTKLSNEWMTAYHTLYSVKELEKAKQFITNSIYDPMMLGVAKNYLKSCAPNAVILTNGDNDTYPLWYVQEGGFRRDVHVINISLLNTEWYFEMVQEEANRRKQKNLFSYSKEDFYNDQLNFAYVMSDLDTVFHLSDLSSYLKNEENNIEFNSSSYPAVPSNTMEFAVGNIDRDFLDIEEGTTLESALKWKINSRYLMRSDLLILDMIENNFGSRPIYFAVTNSSSTFQGLDNYLRLEGMAYRLVPVSKSDSRNSGWVGIRQSEENLINRFDYSALKKASSNTETAKRFVMNYRINMYRLAESYLANEDEKKAKKVMAFASKTFPTNKYPMRYEAISSAEVYYRLNIKKANKIILDAASNMDISKKSNQRMLQYMISLAEQNGQEETASKLKSYFN